MRHGRKSRSLLCGMSHNSERGVRPLKTQQKISGRLASDDVTQDRLDIRSYINTARKHVRNAMDVLHDLMLGRPWRPPAHAFSP
jgi:transposase